MLWVRIDNRLVHGQIIEAWLPFTGSRFIAVINDELSGDPLRREIMSLAIPQGVDIAFLAVKDAPAYFEKNAAKAANALVIFSTCLDARSAYELGFAFSGVNIGNLHYGPGKRQICTHVAVSRDDQSCLEFFSRRGVNLDFRCVPNDQPQVELT
ncbi:MAG: PTS sugar transporter subunit IIB [Desulfovibrionaceae bacterium]|nr:PTS sugar transporter subunit IIB [Desulfovibrionaceae bacterium]MBF0514666.1 PTS sugar transporter subunit IIB [Desulfovibrionaceae bacterium]